MFTIKRTHMGYEYTDLGDGNTNGSPYSDKEIARWVVSTMGFLLTRGETLTGPQFAERIARHYSTENPRTAFACAFVRGV